MQLIRSEVGSRESTPQWNGDPVLDEENRALSRDLLSLAADRLGKLVRAGLVNPDRLKVAAFCGFTPAEQATGWSPPEIDAQEASVDLEQARRMFVPDCLPGPQFGEWVLGLPATVPSSSFSRRSRLSQAY